MSTSNDVWTYEEEKAFENAIALHWTDGSETEEQWEKLTSVVTGKSVEELQHHYNMLVEDVRAIEAGHIPVPDYVGEEPSSLKDVHGSCSSSKAISLEKKPNSGYSSGFSSSMLGHDSSIGHSGKGGLSRSSEQERKKGIPWTEDEHRLFLLGLEKFGKGDWRSISRSFVVSRTPTQVASHAQKYFKRLNSMSKDRRRSSIHDITSINNGDANGNPAPITGQHTNTSPSNTVPAGLVMTHRAQPHIPAGIGMYGTPLGHPIAAPPGQMVSAIGTPVMLPPRPHPHAHSQYVFPLAYPMAPPTLHQPLILKPKK